MFISLQVEVNAGIGYETQLENMRGEMGIEETWSKTGHIGHGSGKKIMAGWKSTRKWALRGGREEGESAKTDFNLNLILKPILTKNLKFKLCIVAHSFNSSTQEIEAGGS